jgi:small subunit ribosomal protein S4
MARYTGPAWRQSRREKIDLFPKSSLGKKSRFAERAETPPGMHGQARQKLSDYGVQLREKQKVKRIYGVLEKQFRNYYHKATHSKGVTGVVLLQFLEQRLDNVVYRMGFMNSRRQARQAVGHGHVHLNGRPVNIPSHAVKQGDVIEVKATDPMKARYKEVHEQTKDLDKAEWLEVDMNTFKATVKRLPNRSDISMPIQEQLIVELYSK